MLFCRSLIKKIPDTLTAIQFKVTAIAVALSMWSISIAGLLGEISKLEVQGIFIICFVISIYLVKHSKVNLMLNYVWILYLIISIQFSFIFSAVYLPSFVWDEVAYNAALPKLYANAKHFFYVSDYGPYSAFPQNYEAITTASILLFDSPIISKILNFMFVAGLAISSFSLSRISRIPLTLSLLSASFVISCSGLIFFIPIAKNDIANAFFQSLALVFLILYIHDKRLVISFLIAFFLGASLGIKFNSLLFSITPILVFTYLTFVSNLNIREKKIRMIVFSVTAIVFSAPWFMRNIILFGNPFYPMYSGIFGNLTNLSGGYIDLLHESLIGDQNFSWETGSLLGFLSVFTKSLGYPIFILGTLGGLFAFFSKASLEIKYISFYYFAILLLTIRFGLWELRYVYVLLVLLSVLTVNLLHVCINKIDIKISSNILISCLISMALVASYRAHHIYEEKISDFHAGGRKLFLEKYVHAWNVVNWLNTETPKNAKIGIWGAQFFYYLNRPYFHIHPMNEKGDFISMKSSFELYSFLKNENISYLCLGDDRYILSREKPKINEFFSNFNYWADQLIVENKLVLVHTINGFNIYKVVY